MIRNICVTGIEAVAYPGLGENIAGTRGVGLNLLAQVADKHAQVFILFDVVSTPKRGEERAMSQHFSGMLDEVDQQIKLFRREMDRLATNCDLTCLEIDVKVTRVKRRLCSFVGRGTAGSSVSNRASWAPVRGVSPAFKAA